MLYVTKKLGKAATVIAAAVIALPAIAQQIPSETWMGIYFGQAKVGYASYRIDKAAYKGKSGYKLESTSVTHLLLLGEEVGQDVNSTAYLNDKFEPLEETFKMSSSGHTTTITARFGPNEITAEVESEGKKSTKKIPIPKDSKIVGDSTYFSGMNLKVGDKLDIKYFNPLSLSLDDVHLEVLRQEELKLGNEIFSAFVIKSQTALGDMTCWQDSNGELLKVVALMGITMVREPKDVAMSTPDAGTYTPPSDLAVATSAPTTTEIPYPRQVRHMKITLSGLTDKALIINDTRQKVMPVESEKPVAQYEITARQYQPLGAASLPISKPELEKYLSDGPYVQPTDPEIVSAAKQIVGGEKNSYKAASMIRAWIHAEMQSKSDIGILRSSVDVLHAKTGVCRDYAILYTALARAAGIPTKLVAGLVFWKGGFYYHAWAESYIGEWIPMDATLPTDLVDATHIKLAEGDATAMFDMIKIMGTLKAEIVEFK